MAGRVSVRDFRPCGECGELVPAETGCKHWKPKTAITARDARRVRQREKEKAARELARASVAAFRAVHAPGAGS